MPRRPPHWPRRRTDWRSGLYAGNPRAAGEAVEPLEFVLDRDPDELEAVVPDVPAIGDRSRYT